MITIHKPANRSSAIKVYAHAPSRTRPGLNHLVTFICKPGMERWDCSCEDQTIIKTAKRRDCQHIKDVWLQLEAQAS